MDLSLQSIHFLDPASAERNFRAVAGILSEPALTTLRQSLRQSPDPDSSLNYLERFLKQAAGEDESLLLDGNRLPILTAVFGNSHFLAETLFRYPELLAWALDESRLYRSLSTDELRSELGWFPSDTGDDEAARTLARFKRMHLLRIVIRDLFHFATLADVTEELSNLADAILQGAREHIHQQLVRRFGRPLTQADTGPIESHFVVLALGKLGGRELNYSSDIDLMYLYTAEAETSGPVKISGREFFGQLAQRLTRMLSKITPEGSCFRVDLRLRPEGGSGELALPLSSALKYYHSRARDWELEMLIKARPVAGDQPLGNAFLTMLEPRIYQTTTDFSLIERVAETRDRIQKKLSGNRDNGLNVKLSRGGIRDIEFLVQCLQRLHGGREPWVRGGGTLLSLHRLRDKGYLSSQDYSRLYGAYSYLRTLEHRLQIEHNRQTHTIPSSPEPRRILTRKMYGKSSPHADSLGREVERHLRKVSEIYERVIGGQRPIEPAAAPPVDVVDARPDKPASDPSWRAQIQHLQQQSPRLAETIADLPIRRGRKHFEHFLNNLISVPGLLKTFEEQPDLMRCAGDLIEHSPHLAEQIIRNPAEAAELSTVVASDSPANTDRNTFEGARHSDLSDSTKLRRFYRRRMLEISARSIYRREPVFATLDKTSRLAEFVIQQALRIATAETERTLDQPRPAAPLQIIALGRLGMREFDLGSDADLVFVLPDEGASHAKWWRRSIEILVDIMSSYTREGTLFTIDSRLRPMGRDGPLIQTESRFKQYFSEKAEAWEAITYMKARTIAGDFAQGTKFLTELQDEDWRRYGISDDPASELVLMRKKIEDAHGIAQPIKAGPGGYYDVDFILMYLRLRNAGLFFPSLNTPERIEVLRTTKALTGDQAETLESAAEFLRALDHAVRIAGGPSAHKIPTSVSQTEIINELVGRWSRVKIGPGGFREGFEQVRRETRELFQRIFATNG